MARAVQSPQVTPADELRELLARNEKRLPSLTERDAQDALELLLDLDRVAALWPRLEASGVDLRPEQGRWETLQAGVKRHAAKIVRAARTAGGLPALLSVHHPDGQAAWWWSLERLQREQRSRTCRRAATTAGAAAVLLIGLYLLIARVLFPVDPAVREAATLMLEGERKATQAGDYPGSLIDYRRAIELTPTDAEAWLRMGVTLERMGDGAAAEEAFVRARALLGTDSALWLGRAGIYLAYGMSQRARTDVEAVIGVEPDNAVAYYYLATIYESGGQIREAIDAIGRAADLAAQGEQDQLVALARYRQGILMQQVQAQQIQVPTLTP